RFSRDWSSDVCSSDLTVDEDEPKRTSPVIRAVAVFTDLVGQPMPRHIAIEHCPCIPRIRSPAAIVRVNPVDVLCCLSHADCRASAVAANLQHTLTGCRIRQRPAFLIGQPAVNVFGELPD